MPDSVKALRCMACFDIGNYEIHYIVAVRASASQLFIAVSTVLLHEALIRRTFGSNYTCQCDVDIRFIYAYIPYVIL